MKPWLAMKTPIKSVGPRNVSVEFPPRSFGEVVCCFLSSRQRLCSYRYPSTCADRSNIYGQSRRDALESDSFAVESVRIGPTLHLSGPIEHSDIFFAADFDRFDDLVFHDLDSNSHSC